MGGDVGKMKFLFFIFVINAILFSLVTFDVFSVPKWAYIFMCLWLGGAGLIIIKGRD